MDFYFSYTIPTNIYLLILRIPYLSRKQTEWINSLDYHRRYDDKPFIFTHKQ